MSTSLNRGGLADIRSRIRSARRWIADHPLVDIRVEINSPAEGTSQDERFWVLRSYELEPGDKLISETDIGPDDERTRWLIKFLFDCDPDPYGSNPIAPPMLASRRSWFIDCDRI